MTRGKKEKGVRVSRGCDEGVTWGVSTKDFRRPMWKKSHAIEKKKKVTPLFGENVTQ